ncbi:MULTISPECIES: hypothetical protein [Pseudoalteromonas]|uniref:hypothetical protein n=1 Tax=Pseudoalteromonas TaxID=53246 RepID=UPI000FFE79CA|nr:MULTISPECIES: hypothetical protein [Pseudoalteromonas]NKC18537.1 hypothetical protein [Pseudoalteromonas galatheae]RXE84928.1 hypothetical protein DRB05_18425 [Pseudoalteromonas sp. A757]
MLRIKCSTVAIFLACSLLSTKLIANSDSNPASLIFAVNTDKRVYENTQSLEAQLPIRGSLDSSSASIQYAATYHSIVGNYFEAEKLISGVISPDMLLNDYRLVPALEVIKQKSMKTRITMVNEAYHNAKHRALTIALLQPLYDQGYRYLALEALSSQTDVEQQVNKHGFTTYDHGIYTMEATFASLIFEAKTIGYEIISYDRESQDNRAKVAALELQEKVFNSNPDAKLLIHLGFSQLDEQKQLASELKQQLQVNPLTIDQVRLSEVHSETGDGPLLLERVTSTSQHYSSDPERFDLSVTWPKTIHVENRPSWISSTFRLKKQPLSICKQTFPCYLELAFFTKESNKLVPIDKITIEKPLEQVHLKHYSAPLTLTSYNAITGELIAQKRLNKKQL